MIAVTSEQTQVKAVLDQSGRGVHVGDPAARREVFHPNATIVGYYESHLILATVDEFVKVIESMPVPATQGEAYNKEVEAVTMAENVAITRKYAFTSNLS